MDTKILENLGLTKSEISVYLALLELGTVSTGPLTTKAKVSRSKIYEILQKLINKGLVSYSIKKNIKYFEASPPSNLKNLIESKREMINKEEKDLDKILPELEVLSTNTKEQIISTVYEGYKGIKTVFNDILKTMKKGEEYYAIATSPEKYSKEFSIFIMNYHKKREEKGIKVKLLADKNIKERTLKELSSYKGIQFKFTKSKTPNSTLIYKNKVLHFIWNKNPTAVMIKSEEIYKNHKSYFNDLWKKSKP